MKTNTKALTVPALYRMCYAASILSCVLLSACRQEQIDAFGMATEILVAVVEDSCEYAFDGACDEPTYCDYGTDTTDCSGSSSSGYGSGNNTDYGSGNNSCQFAFDGACDEPTYCDYGTDTTDCSGSSSSGYGSGNNTDYGSGNNSCQFAFDGACDEPTYCDYGTDTTDCSDSSSSGYYGEESDDLLLIPGWSEVPNAFPCVSINDSVGGGTQFIVNNCNHKVHVEWCYVDRPGNFGQCDPGPPGLGLMDDNGHFVVTSPDYYQVSEGLSPKPSGDRVYGHDHSSVLELGLIKYIACGYEHITGAWLYEMQWDAYTGMFRCLAYFPPEEPYVPPESIVQ